MVQKTLTVPIKTTYGFWWIWEWLKKTTTGPTKTTYGFWWILEWYKKSKQGQPKPPVDFGGSGKLFSIKKIKTGAHILEVGFENQ